MEESHFQFHPSAIAYSTHGRYSHRMRPSHAIIAALLLTAIAAGQSGSCHFRPRTVGSSMPTCMGKGGAGPSCWLTADGSTRRAGRRSRRPLRMEQAGIPRAGDQLPRLRQVAWTRAKPIRSVPAPLHNDVLAAIHATCGKAVKSMLGGRREHGRRCRRAMPRSSPSRAKSIDWSSSAAQGATGPRR